MDLKYFSRKDGCGSDQPQTLTASSFKVKREKIFSRSENIAVGKIWCTEKRLNARNKSVDPLLAFSEKQRIVKFKSKIYIKESVTSLIMLRHVKALSISLTFRLFTWSDEQKKASLNIISSCFIIYFAGLNWSHADDVTVVKLSFKTRVHLTLIFEKCSTFLYGD